VRRPTESEDQEELREGMARILKKGNDVFYNEAQVTAAVRMLSLAEQWLLGLALLS
jgi:hypothetical protein